MDNLSGELKAIRQEHAIMVHRLIAHDTDIDQLQRDVAILKKKSGKKRNVS